MEWLFGMGFYKQHAKTVHGTTKEKPEDAFKPEKRSTNEIWRTMQRAQTLQTMRGKTTTPLTSITPVLLTKAITASEKH